MKKTIPTRFRGWILGTSAALVLGGTFLIWWRTLPTYDLINDSSRKMLFSLSIRGERKDIELQPHECLPIRYTGDRLPEKITFWPCAEFGSGVAPGEAARRGPIDFRRRCIGMDGAMGTLLKRGDCNTHLTITYQEPPLSAAKGDVVAHIVCSALRENFVSEDKATILLGVIVYGTTESEKAVYFNMAGSEVFGQ